MDNASVHAILPALDMDRARAFWTEKVGATPGEASDAGAFFTIGSSTFSIYPTPNPSRGGHTQMGIRVPDAEAAVKELRSRGVTFEEYDMPGLKTVDGVADLGNGSRGGWFKDTEGNIVGVITLNM